MKTKRGEKEKLRWVILEKALSYLKEHGRSGSGTDPLMEHMGLTRGALYSHFKDKDDLFAQAVSHDLQRLESTLISRFESDKAGMIAKVIDDHLSERSLMEVGSSCVFTSLSSDMNRSSPAHRAIYEEHMERLYHLFADALKREFPRDSDPQLRKKAINLYSALVGSLTMARTVKDPKRAREVLVAGREFLKEQFTRRNG